MLEIPHFSIDMIRPSRTLSGHHHLKLSLLSERSPPHTHTHTHKKNQRRFDRGNGKHDQNYKKHGYYRFSITKKARDRTIKKSTLRHTYAPAPAHNFQTYYVRARGSRDPLRKGSCAARIKASGAGKRARKDARHTSSFPSTRTNILNYRATGANAETVSMVKNGRSPLRGAPFF